MNKSHYGGTVEIVTTTTETPISMIGFMSGVCWNADTSDSIKNYKRGIECILNEHGRTFEFPTVYMILDKWSARVIREFYTHIGGGPTRLQSSTRYVDYSDFGYVVPPSVSKNAEAETLYAETMATITEAARQLEKLGVPREDAAMLLPLGMDTKIVVHMNMRTLMDMSRQRMCNRAYHEFRFLFRKILDALRNYSDEWATVCDMVMKPKCEYLGYCPEKKSCGKMPQKNREEGHFEYVYSVYCDKKLQQPLPDCITAVNVEQDYQYDYHYSIIANKSLTPDDWATINLCEDDVYHSYVRYVIKEEE